MTGEGDMTRTADQLRAALGAAADLMVVQDAAALQAERHVRRARGWLVPLTAAASVVVIALAAVFVAHLAGPGRTPSGPAAAAQAPRPEFYMTASYSLTGPNDLHFQVRRTAGGAVTDSMSIPAANVGWGGYLAAASDRAFYFAHYPYCTKAVTATTFSRITITGSGRISGVATVGRSVPGMVTDFAVSPDGSRMAYNVLPPGCAASGSRPAMNGDIQIMDLSTGAIRTWQNTAAAAQAQTTTVGGLSWAPDGRTLVIDEDARLPGQTGLTVYRLDTASSGGSLQGHSATPLRQNSTCSTCVTEALAGPDGSLTALESHAAGQQHRILVVSIPPGAGSPPTVLYSQLSDSATGLFADPSGQWLLLWPAGISSPQHQQGAGWISGGQLHPLSGVASVFPQGIAW